MSNDDVILQACLKLTPRLQAVPPSPEGLPVKILVLLTNDSNLRLKARVHGIATRDLASFYQWYMATTLGPVI